MDKPDKWNQEDWDKLVAYCKEHGLDIEEFVD